MNKIIIGTAQLGLDYGITNQSGLLSEKEVIAIIKHCQKNDFHFFDTAPNYELAETRLGLCVDKNARIISKISKLIGDIETVDSEIEISVRKSLERLKIPCLEGILVHNPWQLFDNPKLYKQVFQKLNQLKYDRIVKKIGISVYSPQDISRIVNPEMIDIIQLPMNAIDGRWHNSESFDFLKYYDIEVHARSVFLQGLLLVEIDELPPWALQFSNQIEEFQNWCAISGLSKPVGAVAAVLRSGMVDKCVIGFHSIAQLDVINVNYETLNLRPFDHLRVCDENLLDPRKWNF